MNNYEAIAYACVALEQLKKEGKEITVDNLRGRVFEFMDMHTTKEINNLYSKALQELARNGYE